MSASSPIPVSEELITQFKKVTDLDTSIRFFQLQIKNEQIVVSHSCPPTNSVNDDFDSMSPKVTDNEACYFLFRIGGPKEWILITYVPDGVSVKDKMVYASAKNTLKDKFGHTSIVEEMHTTLKTELSYESYKGNKKAVDSRSESEITREKVHKLEDDAREEQTINRKSVSLGGYHAVSIPLSEGAKQSLGQLKSGQINFVQLEIDEKKENINAVSEKTVTTGEIAKEINTSEPRFYIYNKETTKVLIYCCPEKSPAKLRMVYSTCVPSVAEQVSKLGIQLASKRVEITDGTELAEQLKGNLNISVANSQKFTGRLQPTQNLTASTTPFGDTVKSAKISTIANPAHPVYNLMDKGNMSHGAVKKKVVMPPPGAY